MSTSIGQQIQDLEKEIDSIYAQLPSASWADKATLLARKWALDQQIEQIKRASR